MPVENDGDINPEDVTFVVKGQVQFSDGRPRVRCKVRAFDRDLRSEKIIGETITDQNGSYEIKYSKESFFKRESGSADLIVRAFAANAKTAIASSETVYNASALLTINLVIDNEEFIGSSEYDSLLEKLAPLLGKLKISNLLENDKHSDFTFLANEINVDQNIIALLPLAHQFSEKTKIPADIYYALLRVGYPGTLSQLYRVASSSIIEGIESAITQNIIARTWSENAKGIVAQFNILASHALLTEKTTESVDFKKMVGSVIKDAGLQRDFVNTFFEHEETPELLFKKLLAKQEFKDGKVVSEIKRILEINVLTGNIPALTTLLGKEKASNRQVRQARDLAELNVDDWQLRIEKILTSGELKKLPEGVEGKTKKQKIKHWAEFLMNSVNAYFPIEVFNHRLNNDSDQPFGPAKTDLTKFLVNNPGFDLKTRTLSATVNKSKLTGVSNKDRLIDTLTTINRLYKLTPNYEHVSVLVANGLTSSTEIVRGFTEEEFINKFDIVFSKATAKETYHKSKRTDKKTTALALSQKMATDLPIPVLMGDNDQSANYQSMFGDNHLCECVHCQSVNSPAAYLVDMLRFIETENSAAKKLLSLRRPDIDHILLNCKNTNTSMPYIDIVNEILSDFITPSGIQAHQTTHTAAELLAYPEHVNPAANTKLMEASSDQPLPANLPINLELTETRLYLDKLGCKRSELMQLFYGQQVKDYYLDLDIAIEILDLSDGEVNELKSDHGDVLTSKTKVSSFLEITSLSYIEMLQLLECQFINPRVIPLSNPGNIEQSIREITINAAKDKEPATCNIEQLVLKGLTKTAVKKIFPFIRLWRYLGWNILDLDRVMNALNLKFNDELIVTLSHIKRLMDKLEVDVATALTFWSALNTEVYLDHAKQSVEIQSQYDSFFQNKQISNPIDADFTRFDKFSSKLSIFDKTSIITAAFNITERDLETLSIALFSKGLNAVVTLENLSSLYRYSILSKSLRITVQELLLLAEMTNIDPFDGIQDSGNVATAAVLKFIEKVDFIKSSPFSIAEVGELLNSTTDQIVYAEGTLKVLTALRSGLKKIELQFNAVLVDPVTSEDAKKVQSLKKLAAQSQFIVDILGSDLNLSSDVTQMLLTQMLNNKAGTDSALNDFIATDFINSNALLGALKGSETVWLFTDLVATYEKVYSAGHRISLLITQLSMSTDEFVYLQKNALALAINGIWNIAENSSIAENYLAFENLVYLLKFRDSLNNLNENWFLMFDHAIEIEAVDKAKFLDMLADLSVKSLSDLEFLLGDSGDIANKGILNYSFPNDYAHGQTLYELLQCLGKAKQLGSSVKTVSDLAKKAVSNGTEESEVLVAVKSILKARFEEDAWLSFVQPISNKLREIRRDALTSYILRNSDEDFVAFRKLNGLNDVNDLFKLFLIDPEMSACMVTSRLKQANSSVQLFIDRCLMGLEGSPNQAGDLEVLDPGAEFSKQWYQWRKLYRVWEANHNVFLYTENWIQPELRDDKSPFFKELETKLSQNEITDDTAKDALIEYLEKLDTVANLDVVGFFDDKETGINHVIGRTKDMPHQYYYRTLQNSLWSAWQKVELDIEGNHLIPVVWNNRLMLFWGVFQEKQEPGTTAYTDDAGETLSSLPPNTYLEMTLRWSEYKNGKWGAKKITTEPLKISPCLTVITQKNIEELFLSSSIGDKDKSTLQINVLASDTKQFEQVNTAISRKSKPVGTGQVTAPAKPPVKRDEGVGRPGSPPDLPCIHHRNSTLKIGSFDFDNCSSSPSVTSISSIKYDTRIVKLNGTIFSYPYLIKDELNSLTIHDSGLFGRGLSADVKLFRKTPGTYRLLPSYHDMKNQHKVKFFYHNKTSNFFATPLNRLTIERPSLDLKINMDELLLKRAKVEPTPAEDMGPGRVAENLCLALTSAEERSDGGSQENIVKPLQVGSTTSNIVYKFEVFYHPYACRFIESVNTDGIDALYDESMQELSKILFVEKGNYDPTDNVRKSYPIENVSFNFSGAYSNYNWELFYHIPMLIATRLSQNQKFDEARKWFHCIFDPTRSVQASAQQGPERYWITKPFKQEIKNQVLSIEELLTAKSSEDDLDEQLDYWEANPFNPHGVARLRVSSYMRSTLMKYIDNLIDWGDQLFRRDTVESTNEATLLYVLAANLLGKKPQNIPAREEFKEQSFATAFSAQGQLDELAKAKDIIEPLLNEPNLLIAESSGAPSLWAMFCIPKNAYLLKYWDKVADRLFKLRNCMNIDGVVRQLPLFEPPIDPALLVKAAAQGLDLNSVLNSIDAQLPHYRYQVMVQKANELSNYVKSLGGQLLSVLERKDAEELSLIRSGQEVVMLDRVRDIKRKQNEEAKTSLAALAHSKAIIVERLNYYKSRPFKNAKEKEYVEGLNYASTFQDLRSANDMLAVALYAIPETTLGPWAMGVQIGGLHIAGASKAFGASMGALAGYYSSNANIASIEGGYERRQDDWDFQARTATIELKQIAKQITAAQIRLEITEKELTNHDLQIENSKQVDEFMRTKYSNHDLYEWMVGQISASYFQTYQLAYDYAKKAEACYRFELGETDSFINYGDWSSMKKRLQSADHLLQDIQRMESSFLDKNKRDYELTKTVSIALLDPVALISLRASGTCTFTIPEVLYDLDHPGHYFRRLKSVSVSLPCIAGPYTSVGAKLQLNKDAYRKDASTEGDYPELVADETNPDREPDKRFKHNVAGIQSIATSTGQNDSGVFELNFRGDRYLPFEGAGAISQWTLELPSKVRQFDYDSISDVLLHIKYTAKEAGALKEKAENSLVEQLATIKSVLGEAGLSVAINLKNDRPNEWHSLLQKGVTEIIISQANLPYMAQSLNAKIESVSFVVKLKEELDSFSINVIQNEVITAVVLNEKISDTNLLKGDSTDIKLDDPFELAVEQSELTKIEEIALIVKYSFQEVRVGV